MESTMKDLSGESVLDLIDKCGIGGGVRDVYGEDRATEDQPITPWAISVARSLDFKQDFCGNCDIDFKLSDLETSSN
ncbi:hypothetical protein SASPL_150912 [Salvia splendens]|uniref:Uncharacterized protein n=1 Tax=Salvia splendens TaxID=180675 RepID=A0A8X8Z338_SALSN|nr:hypothetical protein SASPL_150912 [Salvia splendens]